MKYLLVAATATLALAACGSNEEPAPAETDVTADVTAEPTMDATATGNVAGDYEIKLADGTVSRQRINADGTYVDTDLNGAETERGTWRQQGTQMCFDPEGSDPESCYAGGAPSADGSPRPTVAVR